MSTKRALVLLLACLAVAVHAEGKTKNASCRDLSLSKLVQGLRELEGREHSTKVKANLTFPQHAKLSQAQSQVNGSLTDFLKSEYFGNGNSQKVKKASPSQSIRDRKLAMFLLASSAAAFNVPNLKINSGPLPGVASNYHRASLPRMSPDPSPIPVDVQSALDAASAQVAPALDAAAPVLKSAADTVGSVASASAPVLSGAASVGGTVAKGLFPVLKKGVEVTAPVLQEGVKAAVPLAQQGFKVAADAINDGQLSEETIASLSSAATLPTPEALTDFSSSPLGVALLNFAPYFAGVLLLYLATQAAIAKVKEILQPLVLPTVSLAVLGISLQAGFSFGYLKVPDFIVYLPQRLGLATALAAALYVGVTLNAATGAGNGALPEANEMALAVETVATVASNGVDEAPAAPAVAPKGATEAVAAPAVAPEEATEAAAAPAVDDMATITNGSVNEASDRATDAEAQAS